MELTITNADFHDIGLLDFVEAEFAWGADENDFVATLSDKSPAPARRSVVYSEDGTVGGVVRRVKSDDGAISIAGRTWTGVLAEHVLSPPAGQDYWTASGDVADIARQLVQRIGLSSFVAVDAGPTGIVVSHTFAGSRDAIQQDAGRYMDGWSALWQLVYEHGCKAVMRWDQVARRIAMGVLRMDDHTNDEAMGAIAARLAVESGTPPNHLVCLGQGELSERTVLELWADASGRQVPSRVVSGIDEIADIYDNPSASDAAELRRQGTARLAELVADSMKVEIDAPDGAAWDVGDMVGGYDEKTGVSAKAIVTKKVVRLEGDSVSTAYDTYVRR